MSGRGGGVKRKPRTWAEAPPAMQREALMLINGERIMWNPRFKNWDPKGMHVVQLRWESLGLAIKELRAAAKGKRHA